MKSKKETVETFYFKDYKRVRDYNPDIDESIEQERSPNNEELPENDDFSMTRTPHEDLPGDDSIEMERTPNKEFPDNDDFSIELNENNKILIEMDSINKEEEDITIDMDHIEDDLDMISDMVEDVREDILDTEEDILVLEDEVVDQGDPIMFEIEDEDSGFSVTLEDVTLDDLFPRKDSYSYDDMVAAYEIGKYDSSMESVGESHIMETEELIPISAISDDGEVMINLEGDIEFNDEGYGMGACMLDDSEDEEVYPVVVFEGKYYI